MDRSRPLPPAPCPIPARVARIPRAARIAAGALLLATAVPPSPAVAGPGGPAPGATVATGEAGRARDLFAKGRKAYQAGDMPGAYDAYVAAWAIAKTFDVAANLGVVEVQLKRFRESAEHLTYALANLPVSGEGDKQRPVLQDMLAGAKKEIGTLTVTVSVEGAAVTLDGRPLGTAPLAGDVFVDAGEHVLAASAPGFEPAEQRLRILKGAEVPVRLTLKKAGEVPSPPVSVATGPRPITIAGFVVSGLGLAVGTAMAILAKTKADAAGEKYDALKGMGPNACAGKSPSMDCQMLHDALAARGTFANAALWTFVGAGVVAAGTLVYTFAVPRSPAPKASGLSAVPMISPEGGGLLVRGSF